MEIIKLNSINSTNDFLKSYSRTFSPSNFTVVSARYQTNGRGQRQKQWLSEPFKNLTFSILIKNIEQFELDIYLLNLITSITVSDFINLKINQETKVKWPNDIYVRNKKISGILIELIHKKNQTIDAIVGIGININQTQFLNLRQTTSMALETNTFFELDLLLTQFAEKLETQILQFKKDFATEILRNYNNRLYKRDSPALFITSENKQIMGIIKKVCLDGKIHIMDEDEIVHSYKNGEIQLIIPS